MYSKHTILPLGNWEYVGSPNVAFETYHNALEKVEVEKCAPGAYGEIVSHLRCLYGWYPSDPDCERTLVFVIGQ